MTYRFSTDVLCVLAGEFGCMTTRDSTGLMACINLLCNKWFGGGNKDNFALWKPSIDYEVTVSNELQQEVWIRTIEHNNARDEGLP